MLKFLLDFGPLIAFFATYKMAGLMAATGALIVCTLASLAVTYLHERQIPKAPLVTAILVAVFGGLTLYLEDETFIKLKPTIINLLFAAVLWGGVRFFNKPLLKPLLGQALQMPDTAWRTLSLRWAAWFLLLAGVNEAVWRIWPTEMWVNFKVFGILGLTFAFTLSQIPFIQRHQKPEEAEEELPEMAAAGQRAHPAAIAAAEEE